MIISGARLRDGNVTCPQGPWHDHKFFFSVVHAFPQQRCLSNYTLCEFPSLLFETMKIINVSWMLRTTYSLMQCNCHVIVTLIGFIFRTLTTYCYLGQLTSEVKEERAEAGAFQNVDWCCVDALVGPYPLSVYIIVSSWWFKIIQTRVSERLRRYAFNISVNPLNSCACSLRCLQTFTMTEPVCRCSGSLRHGCNTTYSLLWASF